jgi:xylulokinase
MRILALDLGSSSIKAAYLKAGRVKREVKVLTQAHTDGVKVELPAAPLLQALEQAIIQAMDGKSKLDAIAVDTLSPAVVVLDRHHKVLAGCITHQDRRSIAQAKEIEERVGKDRHLAIAGNRPFAGGIGSTSLLWLKENQPALWHKIAHVGQLSSLVNLHLAGNWMIDPSQAAFTGLYDTVGLTGWSAELCNAIGIKTAWLPEVQFADQIVGFLADAVAERVGLKPGTPIIGGLVDTSAAMAATPMDPGQLVHNSGSTDVLALCTAKPHPADDILTRPVGVGAKMPKRWLAVSTIAAAGTTIHWMYQNFFRDLPPKKFQKLLAQLCANAGDASLSAGIAFDPYLAGDRTSMDQRQAAFTGLTMAAGRDQMLHAVAAALVQSSRARFVRLSKIQKPRPVIYTMGGQSELGDAMHRAWPGHFKFQPLEGQANAGLQRIAEQTLDV